MSNKKGFLTGLIFKDEGEGTPQPASPQEKPTSAFKGSANVQTSNVPSFSSTQSVQGVIDNKFVDTLTGIIEQNNLPGQDYFEFKQAIEGMKTIGGMSDQQKFQTVFTVLSLQGCSKTVLLSSLDKYVTLIQSEKRKSVV